ncbi:MAG: gliding motility-associated C-terminal domain-containing protein [Crocinitomicaceae bacterium]|nr:gliding motility-associated C-terminal domain-containing protein [Crocinitomicaceae bacterium]
MKILLHIFVLLLVSLQGNNARAQSFVNGDLDGIVNFDIAPTGWLQIPQTDPACQALPSALQATTDLVDSTGPNVTGGVAGIAQSGTTFTSGLHAGNTSSNLLWHEGIKQDVSGFVIGATYEISLYQTVLKQENCLDQSGSWRVYLDDILIETTTPTTSALAFDDLNLIWENRIVSFTATSTSHTIKFISWDDDANIQTSYTDITGALRMGIDNISFILPNPDPPFVHLGPDTLLCLGSSLVLDTTSPNSTYLWQDNSTNPTFTVNQAGTYWVDVSNPFGTTRDSITVNYDSIPTVSLENYTIGCPPEPIVLNAISIPSATYLWQDNSTSSSYTAKEVGVYTVTVSNICGSNSASSIITAENCEYQLVMPNVFTPNGDNTNEFFTPVFEQGISEVEFLILNRWGEVVFTSSELSPGWNGEHNGIPCSAGVYFWKVHAQDFEGSSFTTHGNLHLIR